MRTAAIGLAQRPLQRRLLLGPLFLGRFVGGDRALQPMPATDPLAEIGADVAEAALQPRPLGWRLPAIELGKCRIDRAGGSLQHSKVIAHGAQPAFRHAATGLGGCPVDGISLGS